MGVGWLIKRRSMTFIILRKLSPNIKPILCISIVRVVIPGICLADL